MPYVTQWVEADLFLEHQGVRVWHTYSEQEYDSPNHYWFTADEDNTNEESHFDVRELPTYAAPPHPPFVFYGSNLDEMGPGFAPWSVKLVHLWDAHHEAVQTAKKDAIRAAIEQNLLTNQAIEDE